MRTIFLVVLMTIAAMNSWAIELTSDEIYDVVVSDIISKNKLAGGEYIMPFMPVSEPMEAIKTIASTDSMLQQNTMVNDELASVKMQKESYGKKVTPIAQLAITAQLQKPVLILDRRVKTAYFTPDIAEKTPLTSVYQVEQRKNDLYFYTEVWGMQGKTVVHRWRLNGKIINEVQFKINGPRWRIWSQQPPVANKAGLFQVSVFDGNLELLAEHSIAATLDTPKFDVLASNP